jgi:hypothetical protein
LSVEKIEAQAPVERKRDVASATATPSARHKARPTLLKLLSKLASSVPALV